LTPTISFLKDLYTEFYPLAAKQGLWVGQMIALPAKIRRIEKGARCFVGTKESVGIAAAGIATAPPSPPPQMTFHGYVSGRPRANQN